MRVSPRCRVLGPRNAQVSSSSAKRGCEVTTSHSAVGKDGDDECCADAGGCSACCGCGLGVAWLIMISQVHCYVLVGHFSIIVVINTTAFSSDWILLDCPSGGIRYLTMSPCTRPARVLKLSPACKWDPLNSGRPSDLSKGARAAAFECRYTSASPALVAEWRNLDAGRLTGQFILTMVPARPG